MKNFPNRFNHEDRVIEFCSVYNNPEESNYRDRWALAQRIGRRESFLMTFFRKILPEKVFGLKAPRETDKDKITIEIHWSGLLADYGKAQAMAAYVLREIDRCDW